MLHHISEGNIVGFDNYSYFTDEDLTCKAGDDGEYVAFLKMKPLLPTFLACDPMWRTNPVFLGVGWFFRS